jgi:malonate-semialdehyde dehydrogenase (acetylating)/methylmalonate-semialdehyde dehydrogenase
LISKVP